jgi:hypothetical protein
MAVLDEANRFQVFAHALRLIAFAGLTKPNVRAALDATDQWIEDNQASFNTALPQPFRGTASTAVKTLLFCYVAMRRAGVLKTEGEN